METGQDSEGSDATSRWDAGTPTIEKVQIERDRARKEAREAAAKLAKLEKAAKDAEEQIALAKGETSKVLESRDTKIKALDEQLAEAKRRIEVFEKADRQRRLVDELASGHSITDRDGLEGALLLAAHRGMLDPHPEEITEAILKGAKKTLAKIAPKLFDLSSGEETPPAPGPPTTRPRPKPRTEAERDAAWAEQTKGTHLQGMRRPR